MHEQGAKRFDCTITGIKEPREAGPFVTSDRRQVQWSILPDIQRAPLVHQQNGLDCIFSLFNRKRTPDKVGPCTCRLVQTPKPSSTSFKPRAVPVILSCISIVRPCPILAYPIQVRLSMHSRESILLSVSCMMCCPSLPLNLGAA